MMSSATDSSHKIEIESEEINIDMPQDKEPAIQGPGECIYKVPKKLYKENEKAYTPKLISIGPIHRENSELHMERRKKTYCDKFFLRTKKTKEEFESFIVKNKDQICNCYEEEITLPCGKEFVNMILLDSIFIIELFRMTAKMQLEDKISKRLEDEENKNDYILNKLRLGNILSKLRLEDEENKNDYILSKPWLEEGIRHDLRLLENQLPLFILDGLYSRGGGKGFITLACIYFFGERALPNLEELSSEMKDVKHFTDLYRTFYRPLRSEIRDGFQDPFQHLYSATVLQNTAGLIFQKNEETQFAEDGGLLDIYLKSSCLQTRLVVPPFWVQDGTEELFRNLMALEQCHYPFEAYICSYIALLDCLINSKEDVELLVDKRIIVNLLGSSEEVAHMVNSLCLEIVEIYSCYRHIANDLTKLYDSRWNKNMASLRNVYFRDIWRGTATVAGILALFFTFWSFLRTFVSIP